MRVAYNSLVYQLTCSFSASSFQPPYYDDLCLPDPDPLFNDFNVDGNAENVEDWVNDSEIVELSRKNPSKISKAMAMEVSSMLYVVPINANTDLFTETDLG